MGQGDPELTALLGRYAGKRAEHDAVLADMSRANMARDVPLQQKLARKLARLTRDLTEIDRAIAYRERQIEKERNQ